MKPSADSIAMDRAAVSPLPETTEFGCFGRLSVARRVLLATPGLLPTVDVEPKAEVGSP